MGLIVQWINQPHREKTSATGPSLQPSHLGGLGLPRQGQEHQFSPGQSASRLQGDSGLWVVVLTQLVYRSGEVKHTRNRVAQFMRAPWSIYRKELCYPGPCSASFTHTSRPGQEGGGGVTELCD